MATLNRLQPGRREISRQEMIQAESLHLAHILKSRETAVSGEACNIFGLGRSTIYHDTSNQSSGIASCYRLLTLSLLLGMLYWP
jgi:hypothetical protein